jgi:hypothetical protein
MFNRETLFTNVRHSLFGGGLSQGQVDGINADLDYWEANHPCGNLQHLAYIMATDYHESAQTMQPIPESGGKERQMRMYDITGDRPDKAQELGNINPGDGATYSGGKVQLTGRTNFRRLGKRLGIALEDNPELIYDMATSAAVLFVGMLEGLFTGKKLDDYTDLSGNLNTVKARRVVNGTDKSELIAGYSRHWLDALEAATRDYQPPPIQQYPVATEAEVDPVTPFESHLPPDWEQYRRWQEQERVKATTKPKWQSKILITVATGIGSIALARFGIDLPPEQLADVLTGLSTGSLTLAAIFRLFFTTKALR